MGLTSVRAQVNRPTGRTRARDGRFLVDTGAVYTVLPEDVWRALKLKPQRTVEFTPADGPVISWEVSEGRFTIVGHSATSPVVLGASEGAPLLGAATLEPVGLMLNPFPPPY